MPIIAVCPYCQIGRVRAPANAVGLTAPCPRCRTSFTLVDSGEVDGVPIAPPVAAPTYAAPPRHVAAPTAVAEPIASEPYSATIARDEEEFDEPRDPVRAAVLIAFIFAGLALAASQFPYGRFATVGLAALALPLAAACWFGSRQPLWPALATGLNAVILLVVSLLPTWLGIESWRPQPIDPERQKVQSFGADGLQPTKSEYVDVSQAWQFDDVRVRLIVTANVLELAGPKGKSKWSKQTYIYVRVVVGNVGVSRAFEVTGWDAKTPPRLLDAAGQPVALATFEPEWLPTFRKKPASLTPGQSVELDLYFEAPPKPGAFFRLELPASTCGLPEQTIRFQIPTPPLGYRPGS